VKPCVIRQGDFLAKLAHKFGFVADTVWNDPANADLQKLRPNQNILWPTDILYIPDQGDQKPATHALVIGATNTFVSHTPTVPVTVQFTDPSLASQAFTIPELPDLTLQPTGSDGTASFEIPVSVDTFTVAFTASGATFEFTSGGLDPVDTLSGVVQRLQNLGYLDRVDPSIVPLDRVRMALGTFKASQSPDGADADESSPDSDPATDSDAASDSGVEDSRAIPFNAGLGDDGKLDERTAKMLVDAHGS
jgi:hypothetical protein